jgi:YggT family protein
MPPFGYILKLNPIVGFLYLALWLYSIFILIRIILSWINPDPYNRLVNFLYEITDPYLDFFRKYTPIQIGIIDLSPIVAIFALNAVMWVVSRFL